MNKNYYCVIMAGGVGARFWPLSRNSRPKQFIDITFCFHASCAGSYRRTEKSRGAVAAPAFMLTVSISGPGTTARRPGRKL